MSAPDLRGERGFTLIELMVSTLAGIVVASATAAILVSSVHFSSNFSDRVDANQQARTAMEKITQGLVVRISCVPLSETSTRFGLIVGVSDSEL